MPKDGQKNFNVNVDFILADKFDKQIDQRGFKKYRAIEGALRVFMALPKELQSAVIEPNSDPYKILADGIVNAELKEHLEALESKWGKEAKHKLLVLLKALSK